MDRAQDGHWKRIGGEVYGIHFRFERQFLELFLANAHTQLLLRGPNNLLQERCFLLRSEAMCHNMLGREHSSNRQLEGFRCNMPLIGEANAMLRLEAEKKHEAANVRIAELRDAIDVMSKELVAAEKEASEWETFLEKYHILLNGTLKSFNQGKVIEVKGDSLPGQVAAILRDKQTRMTLTAIIKELELKGVDISRDNFRTVLTTSLWRRTGQPGDGELLNKTDEGYALESPDFVLTE